MAGETRRQRRDARRALGDNVAVPSQAKPQAVPLGPGEAPAPVVETPGHPGRRRFAFVQESVAELRKVEWPKRPQVIQGTIVVIIACAVVGLYLWVADLGFKPFVRDVLLNR